ncbi:hypothetical protein GCM10018965_038070 [Nonomuraea roseola]
MAIAAIPAVDGGQLAHRLTRITTAISATAREHQAVAADWRHAARLPDPDSSLAVAHRGGRRKPPVPPSHGEISPRDFRLSRHPYARARTALYDSSCQTSLAG